VKFEKIDRKIKVALSDNRRDTKERKENIVLTAQAISRPASCPTYDSG